MRCAPAVRSSASGACRGRWQPAAPPRACVAAGLTDVRVLWAGPVPHRTPQFWLSLDSPEALSHLLDQRPATSTRQAALRPLWRACARAGLLAPLCAIGRVSGGEGEPPQDGIEAAFPAAGGQLLLTGGHRSINKVVGLAFATGAGGAVGGRQVRPRRRAPTRHSSARRRSLRTIERDRPGIPGVPRLLAEGRRAGRRALAESAVHGQPLISSLSPESFGELAGLVGDWLAGLTGGQRRPRDEWWPGLVGGPLARFERNFGDVLAGRLPRQPCDAYSGRSVTSPIACEHRDCSPWNVVLDEPRRSGPARLGVGRAARPAWARPCLLPRQLRLRPRGRAGVRPNPRKLRPLARPDDPVRRGGGEPHRRVLRPARARPPRMFGRLRLLCWVVHSPSDHHHLEMAAAGAAQPEALRDATFLGLIEEPSWRRSGASGAGAATRQVGPHRSRPSRARQGRRRRRGCSLA